MVWQSAGRLPSARRAMTPGSSSNRDSPVTSTSNAGSRSSSSARASRSAVVRRALRAGDTVPTWLARRPRRPAWNAPPSESRTSASPYQLRSSTVPSGASSSSEHWSPADVALVCTTRSRPPAASSGRANAAPSAAATSARVASTSTSVTSTPGNRASSRATQQPTIPAPTTATRSPTSGGASQRALTAVSTVPASTARAGGTSSGTTVTAPAGTTYAVWCGYRQKTVRPRSSGGPCSTAPTLRYPYLTGPGNSPSWNGARIAAYWLGGTPPRNTSVSVPRLTPDRSVRTTTSSLPGSGSLTRRISPRPGPRSQNACASSSTSHASASYGIGLWYADPPPGCSPHPDAANGDLSPERAARVRPSAARERARGSLPPLKLAEDRHPNVGWPYWAPGRGGGILWQPATPNQKGTRRRAWTSVDTTRGCLLRRAARPRRRGAGLRPRARDPAHQHRDRT